MSHLSPAQLQTLKTAINAVPAWAALPQNSDTAYFIAGELNKTASPAFTVWKNSVTVAEVGKAFNSSEVGSRTTAETSRLQVMQQYSGGTFDPSRADTRAGFDAVFSAAGGVNTRAALLALYKRNATAFEKVYATGTGSDASPATLGVYGVEGGVIASPISYQHIEEARAS
jgi:hypothetical protein